MRLDRTSGWRAALALTAGSLLLSACGSSGPAHASGATPSGSPGGCAQLSAVLANGPDPDADPVGYAAAQVMPLRQLHFTDSTLRTAVHQLSTAYQQFSSSKGDAAAKAAVTKASHAVTKLCPGAS